MKEGSCSNVNWDLLQTVLLVIAYIQLHKRIAKAVSSWNANEGCAVMWLLLHSAIHRVPNTTGHGW